MDTLWITLLVILHYIKTHWGRVTHICVSNLAIIGSDNGLSPGRRQAIIWTNAGILLIGPIGTNFCENWIEIPTFSFTKMRLKVSSAKWRSFRLGLNVLIVFCIHMGWSFCIMLFETDFTATMWWITAVELLMYTNVRAMKRSGNTCIVIWVFIYLLWSVQILDGHSQSLAVAGGTRVPRSPGHSLSVYTEI